MVGSGLAAPARLDHVDEGGADRGVGTTVGAVMSRRQALQGGGVLPGHAGEQDDERGDLALGQVQGGHQVGDVADVACGAAAAGVAGHVGVPVDVVEDLSASPGRRVAGRLDRAAAPDL
jgi:hypothetical protein